jgi:hypothetical protein
MVERGEEARLAQEIAEVDVLAVWNLNRNFLVDPGVFGEINGAESATAQWRQNLVLSNDLPTEKHWGEYTACAQSRESGSRKSSEESAVEFTRAQVLRARAVE